MGVRERVHIGAGKSLKVRIQRAKEIFQSNACGHYL